MGRVSTRTRGTLLTRVSLTDPAGDYNVGIAYCQILDSIHGDVSLGKLRWDAKAEYEYVVNFKILQAAFNKHKLDKAVPVERLVKCKMQDNLEFLQWMKRYWDTYFPGGEYDAVGRRHGASVGPAQTSVGPPRSKPMVRKPPPGAPAPSASSGYARAPVKTSSGAGPKVLGGVSGPTRAAGGNNAVNDSVINDLTSQLGDLKVSVDGLEKERDFYFNKLRDIEIIVQESLTAAEAQGQVIEEDDVLKQIQAILYSTEEGFEVPEGEAGEEYEEETY